MSFSSVAYLQFLLIKLQNENATINLNNCYIYGNRKIERCPVEIACSRIARAIEPIQSITVGWGKHTELLALAGEYGKRSQDHLNKLNGANSELAGGEAIPGGAKFRVSRV